MKKQFLAAALCLALCLPCAVFGEEHEHVFAQWVPAESGHEATCEECGETLTAKHYSFSSSIGGSSVGVCAMCGQCKDTVFGLIDGVEVVSQKPTPSKQRGAVVARGMEAPFEDEPEILYAFTLAYVQNGELATWKDVSDVKLPVDAELPESYQLVRVSPAAGDDSVQNPEERVEMESSYEDGVLCFVTKTPALYLVVAKN